MLALPPFQERALKLPGIRKIVDFFEVLGGPSTFSVSYAKADFVEKNPKLVTAFLAAQRQAVANIKRDPTGAINKYVAVTGDNTDRALMEEMRVVLPCAAVRPMPHVDPTGRSCRPVT